MVINKGYTLIEVLVAVGIFTMLITAPTGFFIGSLKAQQKALFSQELIDNISYNLEYISRALRMAKKDDLEGINCLSGSKTNYEITRSGQGIKFRNYEDKCQEFFREWDGINQVYRLKELKGASENYLTPPYLDVLSFKIGPTDSWDQGDNEQPRVTIFLEFKGKRSEKPEFQPLIKIQTTVSQRNLDVTY